MEKRVFRFPLWLVPVCWAITILLGGLLFYLMGYFHPGMRSFLKPDVFFGFVTKATIAAIPAVLISLSTALLLSFRPSTLIGHIIASATLPVFFAFSVLYIYMYFPAESRSGFVCYYDVILLEEFGYVAPLAACCLAGWGVFGVVLLLLWRNQAEPYEI